MSASSLRPNALVPYIRVQARSTRACILRQTLRIQSHFHIEIAGGVVLQDNADMHPSCIRFVKHWLRNSKDAPLSIWLNIHLQQQNYVCRDIVTLLFSEQKRWKEVDINIVNAWLEFPISVRCSPSLASLELALSCVGPPVQPRVILDLSSYTSVNKEAARLTKLGIGDFMEWRLPTRRDSLHLSGLKDLHFFTDLRNDFDATLAVIFASPNLLSLQYGDKAMSASYAAEGRRDERRVMTLPHLEDLVVSIHGSDVGHSEIALDLLDRISCPSVVNIVFQTSYFVKVEISHLRKISAFLSRHISNSIVSFELIYSPIFDNSILREACREQHQDLVAVLRPLRHLKQLVIFDMNLDCLFIEELMIKGGEEEHQEDEILLPSLSVLSLAWARYRIATNLRMGAVEEMLVSRSNCGRGLTKVTIFVQGFDNFAESSERMRALVADGLEVKTW